MTAIRYITRFQVVHSVDRELADKRSIPLRDWVRRHLADKIAEALVDKLGTTRTDGYGEHLTVTLDILTPQPIDRNSYAVEMDNPWGKK